MILSNKLIIKALIRLCRCAGWSVPLLFTNPEDRFSHIEAHMNKDFKGNQLHSMALVPNKNEHRIMLPRIHLCKKCHKQSNEIQGHID